MWFAEGSRGRCGEKRCSHHNFDDFKSALRSGVAHGVKNHVGMRGLTRGARETTRSRPVTRDNRVARSERVANLEAVRG